MEISCSRQRSVDSNFPSSSASVYVRQVAVGHRARVRARQHRSYEEICTAAIPEAIKLSL